MIFPSTDEANAVVQNIIEAANLPSAQESQFCYYASFAADLGLRPVGPRVVILLNIARPDSLIHYDPDACKSGVGPHLVKWYAEKLWNLLGPRDSRSQETIRRDLKAMIENGDLALIQVGRCQRDSEHADDAWG